MSEKEFKESGRAISGPSAGRLTAKAVLKDRILKLRERADSLEALLSQLPDELSPEADEALWRLVVEVHRQ